MSKREQIGRSAAVLVVGSTMGYALSFIRNVILARALSKADFGLAAAFATTLSLLELASRMSFGHQLVQYRGDSVSDFRNTSHSIQFGLGMFASVSVLALSHPIATAFDVGHLWWAFAGLAVVPFTKAFENLDLFRQQRELRYLPSVVVELVPQALTTIIAWPLAVTLQDFRVILWIMIIKSTVGLILSHVVADDRYRCTWNPLCARSVWIFGWPLLINGLLMFGSQQADQLLVAAFLSVEDLASYAVALSIVTIPWALMAQPAVSLMLPILSDAQNAPADFRLKSRACMEITAVVSVALTLPLIISGDQIIRLLYGPKYTGVGPLMAVLSASVAIRFLRFTPAIVSMAKADTRSQLLANLCRIVGLPLAAIVALGHGNLISIAACAFFAEIVAAVVALRRLISSHGFQARDSLGPCMFVLLALFLQALTVLSGSSHWEVLHSLLGNAVAYLILIVAARLSFPNTFAVVTESIVILLRTAKARRLPTPAP